MAIVSDNDEYMGTVSIKHIDKKMSSAELGITVRKIAMGKGYSFYGMVEIFRIAFDEIGLNTIYWCVSNKNERACKFYDKHGFHRTTKNPEPILKRYAGTDDLRWYSVFKDDVFQNSLMKKIEINGVKLIHINTISSVNEGSLSFFEGTKDISFDIKRIYYISNVSEGVKRGFHAHKKLKQLLFCPYGKIRLFLHDGEKHIEITLEDPSNGLIIDKPVWREILWLEENSVLCVAASDYYEESDYIRDYDEFLEYQNKSSECSNRQTINVNNKRGEEN